MPSNGLKRYCHRPLKGFKKNKSPGTDDVTAEFYCTFWNLLGEPLVDSLNHAFSKSELSISQQHGIIRLFSTEGNVDYKIATKALATRVKKVLPSIISNAQTGYLKGRFIGENIRQIADALHFTPDQNFSGIAVFLDLEKVFDGLEWDFMDKALETFNFGENFRKSVKVIYKNISGCVINNGFSSPFFLLQRGVSQGCPLSGLLFVIAVELLSIAIRSSDTIKGIQVLNKEIKLSQYADDTAVFCRDKHSLKELLELANLFQNWV